MQMPGRTVQRNSGAALGKGPSSPSRDTHNNICELFCIYWNPFPMGCPQVRRPHQVEPEGWWCWLPLTLLLLLSRFRRVQLCVTPQTAAHQATPSLGFSRQEHWSGLPFPSPMHESEVARLCPTLRDPLDCSLPGSSIHGIFQARVLKWGAIAFSIDYHQPIKRMPIANPTLFEPLPWNFSLPLPGWNTQFWGH